MSRLRRRNGSELYIYDNGIPIIDLPNVRTRTFPWQIWATNYPEDRQGQGLQGSLSYYSINNCKTLLKHNQLQCAC
eukprot:SAG31_NODE_671_length_12940_cov_4.703606_3_plen_76_part_00